MTELIIIGGGIAGVSAAAALAPHFTVTLLEAEAALGYHASGRSAAMFEENYGNAAVRSLNRASEPMHKAAGVLSPRGILMVALPPDVPAFERDLTSMGMQEIPVTDARSRVPILVPGIARAALHDGASDIDADRLLQGFARAAREHGARIATGARVEAIRRAGRWQVSFAGETMIADKIINAGGSWADEIATMAEVQPVGLTPYRRSAARIPAPGGHDVSGWPMLFGPGETWYAKPDAGKWLVSPAEEDPAEPHDAWADDLTIAEGIARYQAHVTEEVMRVETTWAGLRTFAPDRALVIGEDPNAPGFFWCAGQGGYGFQTAPAAAQLLAALVTESEPALSAEIVTALSPARFRSRP